MRDLHDALKRAGEAEAPAIGARLRDGDAQRALLAAGRRGRRQRVGAQAAIAAVLAVLLVATAVWTLPALRDQEPAVDVIQVGQVARLDPGARDALQCGAAPTGLPPRGVTAVDPALAPEVLVTVATREPGATPGGPGAVPVDLSAAVTVDPARQLVFGVDLVWGDIDPPEAVRLVTAGAVLDADGTVVMTHRGETVRSAITEPAERLRPLEGSFDPFECGDGGPVALSGEHSVVMVAQVLAGDRVVATYVDAGLPADARVTFAPTGQEAVDLHAEQVRQVEAQGQSLADARIGYRPAGVADGAHAPYRACANVALARGGIDGVAVMPWETMPEGLEVGLAPPAPDSRSERVIVLSAPLEEADLVNGVDWAWMRSQREAVLLLFDGSGTLVRAFEGAPSGGYTGGYDDLAWGMRAFARGTECGVPTGVPTDPGTYTAVLSLVASELPGAPGEPLPLANDRYGLELWMVLPDLVVAQDGTVAELPWVERVFEE